MNLINASFRRPAMKQKSDVHISKPTTGNQSRRSFAVSTFIYSFVGVCIVTGLADVILLLRSFVDRLYVNQDNTDHSIQHKQLAIASAVSMRSNAIQDAKISTKPINHDRCAINLFGLPRAFESLVLPSLVNNVVKKNVGCDYYVHYYHLTEELGGRSGNGGAIDPTAILKLRDAVHEVATLRNEDPIPIVEFIFDHEDDFWKKYNDLIEKIRTTKVDDKYLYFPWKAKTYRHPVTTDNIIKMWHSIQSSYHLMEETATAKGINYDIVAMLRSDVVYVTPIDIHDATTTDSTNALIPVTVPDFGKHPVSDRIIYGPNEAVKIWSTERFAHLESHVNFILQNDPGWGLHSERFINYTIFPLIRNVTSIRQHPTLCFFRARADESVWVSDCSGASSDVAAPSIIQNFNGKNLRDVVQDAIGRKCPGKVEKISQSVRSLDCTTISS